MLRFVFILVLAQASCTPFPAEPVRGGGDVGDDVSVPETGGDVPRDEESPDASATCVTEGGCDDGLYCNGQEICLPGAPNADERGCLAGPAPNVDDDIECTVDGCDEATDSILHDPSPCECLVEGADCDCSLLPGGCDDLGQCQLLTCASDRTCRVTRKPESSPCDDGVSCTDEDACDANGLCRGVADDARCNNRLWCDGVEVCDPATADRGTTGCVDGAAPTESDRNPCTTDRCVECDEIDGPCTPGLEGAFVFEPTPSCQCQRDADCEAGTCRRASCNPDTLTCELALETDGTRCDDGDPCTEDTLCDRVGECGGGRDTCDGRCRSEGDCEQQPCQIAACDAGECVYRLGPNGVECPSDCPGAPTGTCWDGACTLPPEGPLGTFDCDDGEDNDCDGVIDRQDPGCRVSTAVSVGGSSTASAGLDGQGAAVAAVHLADATPLPAQYRNTYCVAHRMRYEQEFEDPNAIALDPNLTVVGDAQLLTSGVVGSNGRQGLRTCGGAQLDVGPMPLPPIGNPGDTYMVEVDISNDTREGFRDTDVMLLGWRSDLLPDDRYVLAVAIGPTFGIDGSGRYRFFVANVAEMNQLSLRFAVATRNGSRCTVIDALRVYQVPHLAQQGADPTSRTYLNWTYGETTEPAWQPFESVDLDDFLSVSEDGATYRREGDGVLYGATGLEFEALEGNTRAIVGLPPFTDHPDVPRGNPLILDLAMGSDDADWGQGELMHVLAAGAQGQVHLIASTVPDDLSWIVHPMDLPFPASAVHRTTAVLPEAFKVRERQTVLFAAFPDDFRSDHLVDEVHAYWFTTPASQDVTVEYQAPSPPNSPVLPLRVRSRLPGRVRLRCYWQVPEGLSYPTVESSSHDILFE